MNIVKKVLPLIGILITAILTITFRTIPKGKTWKNYNVVYVKTDTITQNVDQVLYDCGVSEFVSLKNQRIPIMLSHNSIEEAMLKINISSPENKYLYDRQNYFYDSKGEYTLYYIPDHYGKKIDSAVQQLNKDGMKAGIDSTLSYLWLIPAVVIALTIILTFCSRHKGVFFISAILPCIYSLCNAFYANAIAVVIVLLLIFIISNIYNRRGAFNKILKGNMFVIIATGISFFAAFSVSLLSGIIYIVMLAGTVCAFLTAVGFNEVKNNKYEFKPVLICSAKRVSVYGKKSGMVLPVILASVIIIIAYFLFGSFNIAGSSNKDKILLPGKAEIADTKLPDLEDYFRWNWNVITAPYKSINGNSEYDDNHVVYPRFETEDGIVSQKNYTMYYNQSFKNEIYNKIDNLDFYSIETVLKEQGNDFFAGYIKSASYNVSIFSIIMMILCFCMLLFIYFSAIIGKGGKK